MLATAIVLAACISTIGASQLVDAPMHADAATRPSARTTTGSDAARQIGPTGLPLKSTTARLTSSANPASAGAVVTYSVRVSPVPNGGTVAFADSGNWISAACEYAPVDRTTGLASCHASYDTPTTRQISAIYRGASAFAPSEQTAVITEKVIRGAAPRH